MEQTTKVQCTYCDRKYFVYDSVVPYRTYEGEAFPSECPFCEEGKYAILAGDDKEAK